MEGSVFRRALAAVFSCHRHRGCSRQKASWCAGGVVARGGALLMLSTILLVYLYLYISTTTAAKRYLFNQRLAISSTRASGGCSTARIFYYARSVTAATRGETLSYQLKPCI